MKNVVHHHQLKKIRMMMEMECSMAFSTDGLDGNDVDQSSIYDFTIYFYDKEEICTEVVYVKGLETPCTGEVIADFLLQCLTDIEVVDSEGKPKLCPPLSQCSQFSARKRCRTSKIRQIAALV